MNAKLIIAIVFFMLFVGFITQQVYPETSLILPDGPGSSSSAGGWHWDWILGWVPDTVIEVFDYIGTFIALITWQLDESVGIPSIINTLVFIPFAFGIAWLVASLVRGSEG